ncbi:hypothetical protein E1202_02680 [Saccharopolyspora karakumensis]|uniref:Zinc-finger n=1 Tax=Saccharopolyspora karakumensis TaxID=2530386 RepID=A0A4R5C5W7_9PSEU|nr:hypothetical protein [Saccharopolyspora karakumensis]TDD92282.1 hypothetical protein E1202_02680 [Saccharopolyspora karakumensis]
MNSDNPADGSARIGSRSERHYWLPVSNRERTGGVRHAFRGARWDGKRADLSACGERVALAQPSELDWILSPACLTCNDVLKEENLGRHG